MTFVAGFCKGQSLNGKSALGLWLHDDLNSKICVRFLDMCSRLITDKTSTIFRF